jgi:hypothetical protein
MAACEFGSWLCRLGLSVLPKTFDFTLVGDVIGETETGSGEHLEPDLMSIRYRVHRNLQVVHTVIDAAAEEADLCAYGDQVVSDVDFDSGFDRVVEFVWNGQPEEGSMTLRALYRLLPLSMHIQRAVVAPGDLDFGISRQFQLVYDLPDEQFAVFRCLTDALEWLGIETHQTEWSGWKQVGDTAFQTR